MSIIFTDIDELATDRANKNATRQHYERQASYAETLAAAYAAEEDALANMDVFGDWLASECAGHGDVRTGCVPNDPEAMADKIVGLTVPQLVAHMLYPRAEVVMAASQELQRRYLASRGVPAQEAQAEPSQSLMRTARRLDRAFADQIGPTGCVHNEDGSIASASATPPAQAEPVGEAERMSGNSGFTLACFRAADVPVGTKLYATPPAQAEPDHYEFELEQGGSVMASGAGSLEDMRAEAAHYALMYGQDGPVKVVFYEVRRKAVA